MLSTHMDRTHCARVRSTSESQVGLCDVQTRSHNGTVFPVEALLCAIRQLQCIDRENQRLGTQLLVETSGSALLLGFSVGIVEIQSCKSTFPLLSNSRLF